MTEVLSPEFKEAQKKLRAELGGEADVIEGIARRIRFMYVCLRDQGFTQDQAMELARAAIEEAV